MDSAHRGERARSAGHSYQISCFQADSSGTSGPGSSSLRSGDSVAKRGRGQDACQAPNIVQSLRVGTGVRATGRAHAPTPWTSGGLAEDHPSGNRRGTLQRDIIQCRLEDRNNTCYMNASIISICWQMTMTSLEEALPQAWKLQLRGRAWYPRNFLRLSLAAWRLPEAQHDAAEFLTYLLPRIVWYPTVFSWSVRCQIGDGLHREDHADVRLLHLQMVSSVPTYRIPSMRGTISTSCMPWTQHLAYCYSNSLDSGKMVLVGMLNMVYPSTYVVPLGFLSSFTNMALNADGRNIKSRLH